MPGMYVQTEDGKEHCACSVEVEVTEIVVDEERGRKYYAVWLGEPLNAKVFVPTKWGAAGIARAAAEAGAWVDRKLLVEHLNAWFAENWGSLSITKQSPEENSDDDPEAIGLYEQFLLWVDVNITRFDCEDWGRIEEGDSERKILVLPPVLASFFQKAGIRSEVERRAVLRYWKRRGWLRTQPSQADRYTKMVRWGEMKILRRLYEIVEKIEETSSAPQSSQELSTTYL